MNDSQNNMQIYNQNNMNNIRFNETNNTIEFPNAEQQINNNSNLENILFNEGSNQNVSAFLEGTPEVVIEEEVFINEKNRIYHDDSIYLKDLQNELLATYPVSRQGSVYIQRKVEEEAKQLVELKNIGMKQFQIFSSGVETKNVYDIIHNKISSQSNVWFLPIVYDKHRIYAKLGEGEEKDDQTRTNEIQDAEENVLFTETQENKEGIVEDNQKVQMCGLSELFFDYLNGKINFQNYLNKVKSITQPYLLDDKNKIIHTKFTNPTRVLRYFDFSTDQWNTRLTENDFMISYDVLDERQKIKGLRESVLMKGEEVCVIGYMLLPYAGYKDTMKKNIYPIDKSSSTPITKNLVKVGDIEKISQTGDYIILTVPNHGLLSGEKIVVEDTDSFPSINNIYQKSVEIIDKDQISIKTSKKIVTEGSKGVVYRVSKLQFDLYDVEYNNKSTEVNVRFLQSTFEKEEVNHPKIYLFRDFGLSSSIIYEETIKTIVPSIEKLFTENQSFVSTLLNPASLNRILFPYGINWDEVQKEQMEKIYEIIQSNTEALKKRIADEGNLTIDEVNAHFKTLFAQNKSLFQNVSNPYADVYMNEKELVKWYHKYPYLQKSFDNQSLRSHWIFNHIDSGSLFMAISSLNNSSYWKSMPIQFVKDKRLSLEEEQKQMTKNIQKEMNQSKKKKTCSPYILEALMLPDSIKNTIPQEWIGKVPENSYILSNEQIYEVKKKEVILLSSENDSLALIHFSGDQLFEKDEVWKYEKNKWKKTNIQPKYHNLKYLCEFKNIEIDKLDLDDLDCLYQKEYGCIPRTLQRLYERSEKQKLIIEDFDHLEKNLSDDNYKKNLQEQIDFLINKHFKNIADVEQNEFILEIPGTTNEMKEELDLKTNKSNKKSKKNKENKNFTNKDDEIIDAISPQPIMKEDEFTFLMNQIRTIKNDSLRNDFIFRLIETDGILIGQDFYSKKFKKRMNICGHYLYFQKLSNTQDPDTRSRLYDDLTTIYSDNGEDMMDMHICKFCGEQITLNEYDETEGFTDEGQLKKTRQIWSPKTADIESDIQEILATLTKEAVIIDCETKEFRESLLKFGLSMEDMAQAMDVCHFITRNLFPKSGFLLQSLDLLNCVIDSLQKIKTIISFQTYKSREIKKYQEKGMRNMNIQRMEEKRIFEQSYDIYRKIRIGSIITARFLISVQTALPQPLTTSKVGTCVFTSIDGDAGIDFMTCILDEMQWVSLREKSREILKNGILDAYDTFKNVYSIKKRFHEKQQYMQEMTIKKQRFKEEQKVMDESIPDATALFVEKELPETFQKSLQSSNTIEKFNALNKERVGRMLYVTHQILESVDQVIAQSPCTDPILGGQVENSCCTEIATEYIDYYFYITKNSKIPVPEMIDESKTLQTMDKYVNKFGCFHRFQLFNPLKFDGIINQFPIDDGIHTSPELILKTFERFVDKGAYKGQLRQFVGTGENATDIFTGESLKEIKSKKYTITDYQHLLESIEENNMKIPRARSTEYYTKATLDQMKKAAYDYLDDEIKKMVETVYVVLNKSDKNFIPKYINYVRNLGLEILDKSASPQRKQRVQKERFQNIKSFYLQTFLKNLYTIKNNYESPEVEVKLDFAPRESSLELQSILHDERQKLEVFLIPEVRKFFINLELNYSVNDIRNLFGREYVYNEETQKMEVDKDFEFYDANTVLLFLMVSQLNQFLNTRSDEQPISKKGSKPISGNIKLVRLCEFVMFLLEKMEENYQWMNECKGDMERVEQQLIHDFIQMKLKFYSRTLEVEDSYLAYMQSRAYKGAAITEDVKQELRKEDDMITIQLEEQERSEFIKDKAKTSLMKKLGREPTPIELQAQEDLYREELDDVLIEDEEQFDLSANAKGRPDAGADYGELSEFDFEASEGFDYTE